MSRLFEPLTLGTSRLGHRLAMAPLTRYRSSDDWVPLPIIKGQAKHLSFPEPNPSIPLTRPREYYEQRACVPGTLIISEATLISRETVGRYNIPGIWSDAQVAAWKDITDAVHAKGGVIYCQLWHHGRAAFPEVLDAAGFPMLSSSATPIGPDHATPRAMTEEDIARTIRHYAAAAEKAIAAGFDGVEIHGANGYLPDQFLQTTCNKRTDRWGGSVENRARFHLEVTRAVAAAVGAERTGIRLSPYSDFGGMLMDDPDPTFRYLTEQLRPLGLAYLHLVEARISGNADADCGGHRTVKWLVELWDHASPVLIAGGFTPESAKTAADETYKGYDVAIVFGRYFVTNPDLVFRVKAGIPLVKYDRSTFYTPKEPRGYIDYPFSARFEAEAAAA